MTRCGLVARQNVPRGERLRGKTTERVQDAVGNDDDAQQTIMDFTSLFTSLREGQYTVHVVRNLAVELLNDAAPTMIEEFLSLFPSCIKSDTWAGFGVLNDEQSYERGDHRLLAASEALAEEGRTPAVATGTAPAASVGHCRNNSRRGATTNLLQRQGSLREGKAKDWLTLSKTLVPYGRGSYAIWFTIINTSVIVGLFAYMAGDYALWVHTHREKFIQSGSAETEEASVAEYKVRVPLNRAENAACASWHWLWCGAQYFSCLGCCCSICIGLKS
jgi:hypothetical protein